MTSRPWSKYSAGSSAHAARLADAANEAESVKTDAKAQDNDEKMIDETPEAKLAREEALMAFMAASKGGKRKAWENDLSTPVVEELVCCSPSQWQ